MKFYIICPPNYATGGVEALIQLCEALIELGKDAYIVYNSDEPVETLEQYKKYTHKIAVEIENNPDNLVIVPEVYLSVFGEGNALRTKKCVFWLGWHHNEYPYVERDMDLFHSEYVKRQVMTEGHVIYDWLDMPKIECNKKYQVCYSPKRGIMQTKQYIKMRPEYTFIALENMSQEEVYKTMAESDYYIEFGHLPSVDRMPREAYLLGCEVHVGARGAYEELEGDWSKDAFIKRVEEWVKSISL